MARPTKYTDKLAQEICERLADGESLRKICRDKKMPSRVTVHSWLLDGRHESFLNQYTQAREIQAQNMIDEIADIADEEVQDNTGVQHAKLRVDTRKWVAARVLPKVYGNRLDLTSDGKALPTPILASVKDDENDE